MKNNQVSIFVFLILSAVIGGVLFFVNRSSQEYLGWSPDEMYGDLSRAAYDGSACTNATFSGSSNGGSVALSMQGGSLSSRARVSSSRPITNIQYPIANRQLPIANSPSPISNSPSPIANGPSPIAYMTSDAEYRSFGGGGNGNMGAAGTFRTNSQSPITNRQLPISNIQLPIANNQSPISNSQLPIANHPSPIANSQLPIANNPSNMFGYELKTIFGTASYDMMSYYATNGNRINNRFNAPPGMGDDNGFGNLWLDWLNQHYNSEDGTMPWGTLKDGVWQFSWQDAWNAYDSWATEFAKNNPGAVVPLFEEWLRWFKVGTTYEGASGQFFTYVPVGNVLPLFMMALVYMIILFIKRNKTAQL